MMHPEQGDCIACHDHQRAAAFVTERLVKYIGCHESACHVADDKAALAAPLNYHFENRFRELHGRARTLRSALLDPSIC
jgi:hypothetical protein